MIRIAIFISLIICSVKAYSQVIQEDSLALVQFYNDHGGENWINNTNWLSSAPVSEWSFITVKDNRVSKISIGLNGLSGTYNGSLDPLTALEFLRIGQNPIAGIIDIINFPSLRKLIIFFNNLEFASIASATNLTELSLIKIGLTDCPSYENLVNLTSLDLSQNNLTELNSFDNLVNLESLNLGLNEINAIPDLSSLTNLSTIDFQGVPITNAPPFPTNIVNINLGFTEISSPPDFSQYPNLKVIRMSSLPMTQMPDFSNNPNLDSILMPLCEFTELPSFLENPRLIHIQLNGNSYDSIPDWSHLKELEILLLSDTGLQDISGISECSNLKIAFLERNEIRRLPNIDSLIELRDLQLNNNLIDSLPSFAHVNALTGLYFNNNLVSKMPELSDHNLPLTLACEENRLSYVELLKPYQDYNYPNILYSYENQDFNYIIKKDTDPIIDSTVTLSILDDGEGTIYTWEKNWSPIEGFEDTENFSITIDSMSLLENGTYSVSSSNPQFPLLSFDSEPIDFRALGIDSLGGLYIYDQLIVEYEEEASQAYRDSLRMEFDASLIEKCMCGEFLELWQFDSLAFKPIELDSLGSKLFLTDPDEIKKKAKRRPKVNEAGFNYPMELGAPPGVSPGVGFASIGPVVVTDKPKLMLIDTGIDTDLDLARYYWRNTEENDSDNCISRDELGPNFISNFFGLDDDNGHGSHLAGIITQDLDDDFEIINAKVFAADGYGELFDAICAIYYGIDNKADVYNLSWGYYGAPVTILENAIIKAGEINNALVVSSAGNGIDGEGVDIGEYYHFPGSFDLPNMITVAAWNQTENDLATFSNYSDSLVHIAADGVNINPGIEFGIKSGTSQSTAAVSAAAMCVKIDNPEFGFAELKDAILSDVNANDILEGQVTSHGFLGNCKEGNITDVKQIKSDIEIQIYPNPAHQSLHIIATNQINVQLKILDMQGKLISKKFLPFGYITLDVYSYPLGSYVILLDSDTFNERRLFIKQ